MTQYLIIPKGTYLFRTTFRTGPLVAVKDSDTDKTGLYFATVASIAIGMCLEYKANMYFKIFKLTSDIRAIEGKYSFRNINPHRYFTKDGKFIPNVDIDPRTENVNHFEGQVYPIIDIPGIDDKDFLIDERWTDGELFVSSKDLSKVKLIETHTLDWKIVARLWKQKQPFSRTEMFKEAQDKVTIN